MMFTPIKPQEACRVHLTHAARVAGDEPFVAFVLDAGLVGLSAEVLADEPDEAPTIAFIPWTSIAWLERL